MASVASASRHTSVNAIDRDHLRKMTLGNAALEHEVLQLFDKQAEVLLTRMRDADPGSLAALAHALKGSARGIGAWPVAAAAEGLERHGADYGVALDRLAETVSAVRLEIAGLLAA
ncbi:MAG: Hpt domain-containing protein [Pseudolabrys sp.]|nr:Hpt domain-containing protein [Pseudolabrys sp.]MBV9262453.1 Hpt domain-containing protein [Pseudolabrys sp.]